MQTNICHLGPPGPLEDSFSWRQISITLMSSSLQEAFRVERDKKTRNAITSVASEFEKVDYFLPKSGHLFALTKNAHALRVSHRYFQIKVCAVSSHGE